MTDTDPNFRLPAPRRGRDEFNEDANARLGLHIKTAEQALMTAKADALREFGLSVAQYSVLLILFYVPGQSSAQLARASAVSPQTMNTVLTKLEDKKLISRTPSDVHAKILVTSLTPVGEELVLRADVKARAIEQVLTNAFTADERDQLRNLLSRAVTAIHDATGK